MIWHIFTIGVHKYPKLDEVYDPQVFNDTAQLECTFIASNYDYANFVQPQWSKGSHSIMNTSRFEILNPKREGEDRVRIKLIIKSATPDDSGMYFCSIKYSTDIIKKEVESDCGEIPLDIGKNTLKIIDIYILCLHANHDKGTNYILST